MSQAEVAKELDKALHSIAKVREVYAVDNGTSIPTMSSPFGEQIDSLYRQLSMARDEFHDQQS
ncbi:hypothetical protein K3G63_10905 [Hymenobacter sp. HSC-4F20]|uniref:hypothetical protein n=1 Tax=Hymenobacter sp. HSC-4F20 TaxID=2864135 RepID=UPI001C72EB88|nr:hypothetical protein [Hymenobacter sp. HSC-4F20]MBX0290951.1 hypothetical protein [Hymenobacter sp. HSC-4F20]